MMMLCHMIIVNNAKGKLYSTIEQLPPSEYGLLLGTIPQTRIGRRQNQFFKFRSYLDSKGLSFNEGKIIDASFVEAPRQRNTVYKMVGKELTTSGGRTYRRYELSDGRKEKK